MPGLTGTGDALGTAIWEAIKAETGATYTPEGDAQGLQRWKTIAGKIVDHIVENAIVSPAGAVPMNVVGAAVQVNPGTGTGANIAPANVAGTGVIT